MADFSERFDIHCVLNSINSDGIALVTTAAAWHAVVVFYLMLFPVGPCALHRRVPLRQSCRRHAPGELQDRRPCSGPHCCFLGRPSSTSRSRVSPTAVLVFDLAPCGLTFRSTASLWSPLLAVVSEFPVEFLVLVLVLVLNSDFESVFTASQHFLKLLFHVLWAQ